jgi:hypothetical protein
LADSSPQLALYHRSKVLYDEFSAGWVLSELTKTCMSKRRRADRRLRVSFQMRVRTFQALAAEQT